MTVAMEDGQAMYRPPESLRRECPTCDGYGWLRLQGDPTNAHRCPDCAGRGRVPVACEWCGESATHLAYNGDYKPTQPVCDECDPAEPGDDYLLREWDQPAEIRMQQTEARKLK